MLVDQLTCFSWTQQLNFTPQYIFNKFQIFQDIGQRLLKQVQTLYYYGNQYGILVQTLKISQKIYKMKGHQDKRNIENSLKFMTNQIFHFFKQQLRKSKYVCFPKALVSHFNISDVNLFEILNKKQGMKSYANTLNQHEKQKLKNKTHNGQHQSVRRGNMKESVKKKEKCDVESRISPQLKKGQQNDTRDRIEGRNQQHIGNNLKGFIRAAKLQSPSQISQPSNDKRQRKKYNNQRTIQDCPSPIKLKIMETSEIPLQNLIHAPISSELFCAHHTQLCINGVINFPIEDLLFDEYEGALEPFYLKKSDLQSQQLPSGFGNLLEIWNFFRTFSTHFSPKCQNITIKAMREQIESKYFFMEHLIKILNVIVKQFINQKNQLIKNSKQSDFFNILRFCSENGLLDAVQKRCWTIIMLNIMQVLQWNNPQFQQTRNLLQNLTFFPEDKYCLSLEIKAKILNAVIELLMETGQFRKAVDANLLIYRNQLKRKNQLQQQIRALKKQQSKLEQQEYLYRKKMKQISSQSDLNLKKINAPQIDFKIIECSHQVKNELLLKLKKIQNEFSMLPQSSISLTNVCYLGQDKYRNFYWKILPYPDILVFSSSDKWRFYSQENIKKCAENLNLRGSRESNLYKSLNQHFDFQDCQPQKSQFRQILFYSDHKKKEELEQQDMVGTTDISQEVLNLLTESQKKLSLYLQQRTSRWGTEEQRKNFLQQMTRVEERDINELRSTLLFFNQRICVVQSEYLSPVQQSIEKFETKVRKVQTKIWGISQKYKTHWVQLCENAQKLRDIFFLIFVMCMNIQKYTSKDRKKRRQLELTKESNRYLKTKNCRKDQIDWDQACTICNEDGELLCCDTCSKVYHLECIDLKSVPKSLFLCDLCKKGRSARKLPRGKTSLNNHI